MFALDLFNNDHERRLTEGAVDTLEQRRIDDLAMKMDDLVARAKTATTPEAKAALVKEFQKCKDERDSYFKIKAESMVDEGKADYNFDAEDLKRLERIRDLTTLKTQALELISRPSAKPMKPEKVEWFKNALEKMNSPLKVIKLMYDLLLSGEGHAVVGSKSSMNPNSYRQRFGEEANEAGIPGNVPADKIPGKEDLLKGKGRSYYEDQAQKKNSKVPDLAIDRLLTKAHRERPKAKSDAEALAMKILGKEQDDVNRLDHVNDREDRMIAKLDRLEQDLQSQINQLKGAQDLDEGRMGEIDAMRQDLERMNERQFYTAYGISKAAFQQKYRTLLKPALDESQQLHQGDPIVVTAPNEFEGATGEIAEFSPSGKFVIVNLYNHGEHSMHLSDVEYNQFADEEDADEYGDDEIDEDAGPSPVAGAIVNRIMRQRVDLLKQYGPELVGAAVDNVADYVGDVEEIGTSDVSAWVAQVERMLKENPPDAFAEGSLNEFAPGAERDDNEEVPNQILKLANRWWNAGDKQPQITNVLRSLGWSIAQVESEDDAVQMQHDDGTTYFISADDFDPEVFEGEVIPTATGLKHRATKGYGADYDAGRGQEFGKQKDAMDLTNVNKTLTKSLEKGMDVDFKEGFQDFNKVEPYAVCLAGKPVKKFDYYEQARKFHDNWKQKLYREGNKAKADTITLMPLNLDEGARGDAIKQGYQAAIKGLTKQQNPYYKSVNGQTPPEAYDWEAGWEDARDSGKIPQGVAEGFFGDIKQSFATGMVDKLKKAIPAQYHKHYDFDSVKSPGDTKAMVARARAAGHLKESGVAEGVPVISSGVDPKIQFLQPTIQFAEKMGYKATLNPQGRVVAKLVNKQLGHIVHIGLMQPSGKGFEVSMADNLGKQTNAWSAKELAQDFKGWYAQAVKDQDFNNGYNEKPQLEQQGVAEDADSWFRVTVKTPNGKNHNIQVPANSHGTAKRKALAYCAKNSIAGAEFVSAMRMPTLDEQGVAEGDELTHAGQDVMVWLGPPTNNPPRDDKKYWVRGQLDSTEMHGGSMRANVMTAKGMYNPELSRVFNADMSEAYTPSPAKPFRNPPGFNKQGTGVGNKLAQQTRAELANMQQGKGTPVPGKEFAQGVLKDLKKVNVKEIKADPAGSWIVYGGGKVVKFKTHGGAKAYAEKSGGKVASSEFYADKVQGVKEAETDYSKRRQRERDVDAGKPVPKQRQSKMTDYQKRRAQDKKDMALGEDAGGNYEQMNYPNDPTDPYVVYDRTLKAIILTTKSLKKAKQEAIEWAEYDDIDVSVINRATKKSIFRVNGYAGAEKYINEDQDTSGVEQAILRRIMVAHTDLLMKFGPEKVMQAVEEVAYNVGDVDEIGTSDVSAYVAQVKQILGAV